MRKGRATKSIKTKSSEKTLPPKSSRSRKRKNPSSKKSYQPPENFVTQMKDSDFLKYYRPEDQKYMTAEEFKAYINQFCPLFKNVTRPSRINFCLRCWNIFQKCNPKACVHVEPLLFSINNLFGKHHNEEEDEHYKNTYFDNFLEIIGEGDDNLPTPILLDSKFIRKTSNGSYLYRTFGYSVNSDCQFMESSELKKMRDQRISEILGKRAVPVVESNLSLD